MSELSQRAKRVAEAVKYTSMPSVADLLIEMANILEENDKEIENLKSVMIAAAETIASNWQAHCDEEGYGTVNLMNRLEKVIPAEYAYKAGDFARMKVQLEQAERNCEEEFHDKLKLIDALEEIAWSNDTKWQADRAEAAIKSVGKVL